MENFKLKCISLEPFFKSDALFAKALSAMPDSIKIRIYNTDFNARFSRCKAIERLGAFYALELLLNDNNLSLFDLNIYENEYGKPCCDKIKFNISHSSSYAIAAISEIGDVGVDIEEKKDREIERYKDKFFSPSELRFFNNLKSHKERLDYFYDKWCKKESFLKCIGKGIYTSLDKIEITNTGTVLINGVQCDGYKVCNLYFRANVSSSICLKHF